MLKQYAGTDFTMPPLGSLHVKKASDVYTGRTLSFDQNRAVTIHNIDRKSSPADSVVAVVFDRDISSVWKK